MDNTSAKCTDEYRQKTADHIISAGRLTSKVCRELGLNSKTANRWVIIGKRELAGEPDPVTEDAEIREFRRRNRELEMENAFLKEAAAF